MSNLVRSIQGGVPTNLVLSKLQRNTIHVLLLSVIDGYEPETIDDKITALHKLIQAVERLEEGIENSGAKYLWTGIFSGFATAACLGGLAILNPVAGIAIAATSAVAGTASIAGIVSINQDSDKLAGKLKRLRIALKSTQLVDWACIWGLVGFDLFCESLHEAGTGEMTDDFTLVKFKNCTPKAAAVELCAQAKGVSFDTLVEQLKLVKAGKMPQFATNVQEVAQRILEPAKEQDTKLQSETVLQPNVIQSSLTENGIAIRDSLVKRADESVLGGAIILAAPGAGKTTFLGSAWGQLKEKFGDNFKSFAVVMKPKDVEGFQGIADNVYYAEKSPTKVAVEILKFIDKSLSNNQVCRLFLDDFLSMNKFWSVALKGKYIDSDTYEVFASKKEAMLVSLDCFELHEYLIARLNKAWLVGREFNFSLWASSHSSNVDDLPFVGGTSARSVGALIFLAKNGQREFIEFALANPYLISDAAKRQQLKTQLNTISVDTDEPIVLANYNNGTLGIIPSSVYDEYQTYYKKWKSSAPTKIEQPKIVEEYPEVEEVLDTKKPEATLDNKSDSTSTSAFDFGLMLIAVNIAKQHIAENKWLDVSPTKLKKVSKFQRDSRIGRTLTMEEASKVLQMLTASDYLIQTSPDSYEVLGDEKS
jgi:hypothetical protein